MVADGGVESKTDEKIAMRWNYSLRRQLMSTVRKPSAHWQRSVLGEHITSLLVKPYATAAAATAAIHTLNDIRQLRIAKTAPAWCHFYSTQMTARCVVICRRFQQLFLFSLDKSGNRTTT